MKAHELALVQKVADLTPTRLFGMPTEEIFIKMLVAQEHDVPLTSALSTVYIIDKKPSLAPKLIWAKVVGHPEFDGYKEERLTDDDGTFRGWRITLARTNGVEATREFTMADARRVTTMIKGKKKTLADKDNWLNYPEQMCYWRAQGYVQDVVFSDVCQGIYRPEELGAEVDEGGEPLWSEVMATTPPLATVEGAVSSRPHLREMPWYPLPIDRGDSVTTPASTPEPSDFVPSPMPTIDSADSIGVSDTVKGKMVAPEQPEAKPTSEKTTAALTIAALIEAGYTVDAIVAANEGRVPSTAADCAQVAEILEKQ